ncbi:MAG: PorP/SprF family type IX secretion system membrane protein [Bacteroidota bacterium]
MKPLLLRLSLWGGILLFIFPAQLTAQGPRLSQFFANRTFLNPAYAGFESGTTLEVNHRDQWFGVPDVSSGPFSGGFRTSVATISTQLPCLFDVQGANFGFALTGFTDAAGIAGLQTNGIGTAISFELPLIRSTNNLDNRGFKRLDLRAGFQSGWANRSLADDYFLYSYQLDPVIGLPANVDPESLDVGSGGYLNARAGFMLRGMFKRGKKGGYGNRKRLNDEILFTIGLAISNLNEPDITFFDGGEPAILRRRFTVHAGFATSMLNLKGGRNRSKYLSIAPQFRWDIEAGGKLNAITVGTNFINRTYFAGLFYSFTTPNGNGPGAVSIDPILAGGVRTITVSGGMLINWRSNYRTMPNNDFRERSMVLGLSYDLVAGGLASTTGGVLELSLQMNLFSGNKKNCAALGKFELYDGKCPAKF